jgi:hypothetical protein
MEEEKQREEKKEIWRTFLEYKTLPAFWGWALLIALSAALIMFGMWAHFIVPDEPRTWSYGALPDTPAESVYSTNEPPKGIKPRQVISPLPEGKSLNLRNQ